MFWGVRHAGIEDNGLIISKRSSKRGGNQEKVADNAKNWLNKCSQFPYGALQTQRIQKNEEGGLRK